MVDNFIVKILATLFRKLKDFWQSEGFFLILQERPKFCKIFYKFDLNLLNFLRDFSLNLKCKLVHMILTLKIDLHSVQNECKNLNWE